MASLVLTLISSLIFFSIPTSSNPLHQFDLAVSDELPNILHSPSSSSSSPQSPTTFFEVRRPIPLPKPKPCSTLVLTHDFSHTYGLPPVTAPYSPPPRCPFGVSPPSLIVLEWSAACAGRQFDRIFGVWLAGVEILRSCTAEPRAAGIQWTVRKDVTRYHSLFSKPQTLAVYLGNLVDQTYTGVYHVNVSFHIYFDQPASTLTFADLILPISKSLPLNDGLWFQIQNSSDLQGIGVKVPRNAYRAIVEVYLSYHSNDEFWYTNSPNLYNAKNNLTGIAGNGPFREVTVRLDGDVVGAIWPFTVIYTGGINPLLWRPISAIGSFDLPSYDIEITPFLGRILDGKSHSFEFGVTNALDVWFIDANLHLWLDSKSFVTEGSLMEYEAPGYVPSLMISNFSGLDGDFETRANRMISATGWLKSSFGNITTNFFQSFDYSNKMNFASNGSVQVVNQSIYYHHGTYAKDSSAVLYSENVYQTFPLYLYTGNSDEVDDSYTSFANITLGFIEEKYLTERIGFSYSTLRNLQTGEGIMHVKGNLVTSGLGSTQQMYKFGSTGGCYFRNVSSSNYTILNDESGESCTKSSWFKTSGKLSM